MKHNDVVLVQGFGWTGSGALVDYFLDNRNIKLASNDEIPFLKALISLIDKCKKRKRIDFTSGADEVLFLGLTPDTYCQEMKDLYDMRLNRFFSLSNVSRDEYGIYARDILERLKEISERPRRQKVDNGEINRIISDYWAYLNTILSEHGKVLMYDNLISLQRLDLLGGLSFDKIGKIKLFVIDRDPRDQFFELYQLFKDGYVIQYNKVLKLFNSVRFLPRLLNNAIVEFLAAILFVYLYHKPKRIGYQKGLKLLTDKSNDINIVNVLFEDVVLKKEVREELMDTINEDKTFGDDLTKDDTNFNPDISKKNIGKYKNDKYQKKYKFILKSTSKYSAI